MPKRPKKRSRGGASLLCRKCKVPTRVLKTRRATNTIHRERECPSCHGRIYSVERIET